MTAQSAVVWGIVAVCSMLVLNTLIVCLCLTISLRMIFRKLEKIAKDVDVHVNKKVVVGVKKRDSGMPDEPDNGVGGQPGD